MSSYLLDTTLAVYRIVQEALGNIYRHAVAEQAAVSLKCDGNGVELQIRDDGRGFDAREPDWHPGLGLASMEERARLAGGAFLLQSTPGEGTLIRVSLPLGDEDGNEQAQGTSGGRSPHRHGRAADTA